MHQHTFSLLSTAQVREEIERAKRRKQQQLRRRRLAPRKTPRLLKCTNHQRLRSLLPRWRTRATCQLSKWQHNTEHLCNSLTAFQQPILRRNRHRRLWMWVDSNHPPLHQLRHPRHHHWPLRLRCSHHHTHRRVDLWCWPNDFPTPCQLHDPFLLWPLLSGSPRTRLRRIQRCVLRGYIWLVVVIFC